MGINRSTALTVSTNTEETTDQPAVPKWCSIHEVRRQSYHPDQVKKKKILTSNQCMIQVVYRYILTAGTVLCCQVILQGCPSAVSVEPLLLLLLLFLLHVWHTRECIYHHFSLSQQHCIWKRIKEKGKADGTAMYMWTARHEGHRFQLRKLSFFKWVHMYILTDGDSQQSHQGVSWQEMRILLCKGRPWCPTKDWIQLWMFQD